VFAKYIEPEIKVQNNANPVTKPKRLHNETKIKGGKKIRMD